MRNLKARLDRIERRLAPRREVLVLIGSPDRPEVSYDARTFESVEAAVERFMRERGLETEPHVITILPA